MAPGPMQILIIILLIVLVFGAARVPLIAENLAKGIRSFKKGLQDDGDAGKDAAPSQISERKNESASDTAVSPKKEKSGN